MITVGIATLSQRWLMVGRVTVGMLWVARHMANVMVSMPLSFTNVG
jgi:hypothetical protein